MTWFLDNWQTVAALGVVALTLLVFALRLARGKTKRGCGGHCACTAAKDGLTKEPPAVKHG